MTRFILTLLSSAILAWPLLAQTPEERLKEQVAELGNYIGWSSHTKPCRKRPARRCRRKRQSLLDFKDSELWPRLSKFYNAVDGIRADGLTNQSLANFIEQHLFAGWTQKEIEESSYLKEFMDEALQDWPVPRGAGIEVRDVFVDDNGNVMSLGLEEAVKIMTIRDTISYWATVIALAVFTEKKMTDVGMGHVDDGADRYHARMASGLNLSAERLGSAVLMAMLAFEVIIVQDLESFGQLHYP